MFWAEKCPMTLKNWCLSHFPAENRRNLKKSCPNLAPHSGRVTDQSNLNLDCHACLYENLFLILHIHTFTRNFSKSNVLTIIESKILSDICIFSYLGIFSLHLEVSINSSTIKVKNSSKDWLSTAKLGNAEIFHSFDLLFFIRTFLFTF